MASSCGTLKIQRGAPDINIVGCSLSPEQAAPDEEVSATATVENAGTLDASVVVDFEAFNPDNGSETDDIDSKRVSIPAGESASVTITFTPGSVTGPETFDVRPRTRGIETSDTLAS